MKNESVTVHGDKPKGRAYSKCKCPPDGVRWAPGTRGYAYHHSGQCAVDQKKVDFAEARLTEAQYLKLDNAGHITVEDWLWAFKEMGLLKA